MVDIVPTVTAYNSHQFREQLQRIQPFAERIHIDLMDGHFTKKPSIKPNQIYWFDDFQSVDVHLMAENPLEHIKTIAALKPSLIIIHAEAQNVQDAVRAIQNDKIKAGLAILQDTNIGDIRPELIEKIDHALIFSGSLGEFGGKVDMSLTTKIAQLRTINPNIEIGWDGGVDDQTAVELASAKIDVLNVGGFIQRSDDPENNYLTLKSLVQ